MATSVNLTKRLDPTDSAAHVIALEAIIADVLASANDKAAAAALLDIIDVLS